MILVLWKSVLDDDTLEIIIENNISKKTNVSQSQQTPSVEKQGAFYIGYLYSHHKQLGIASTTHLVLCMNVDVTANCHKTNLLHCVATWSDITLSNKIDKPLVVYRFCNVTY